MDCDYPFQVKLLRPKIVFLKNGEAVEQDTEHVPCGRCLNCINTRIKAWVFRLEQEQRISDSSSFVTLTYREDAVPQTPSGHLSLSKDDLTKFFKRLRHHNDRIIGKEDIIRGLKGGGLTQNPIKYYAVGEYGDIDGRPHYHIILFNCGSEEVLYEAWQLGIIHKGTVTGASMAYCAGYVNQSNKIPIKGSDQQPIFSVMSKGLGANFFTEVQRDHIRDVDNYVLTSQGHKLPLPRYYRTSKKLPHSLTELDKHVLKHKGNTARKEKEAKLRRKYGKDYDKLIAGSKLTRAITQKITNKFRDF